MPYNNSRVSDYLEHSELMFTNAKDKTILPFLERHNVGVERCDMGLTLCGEAYTLEKEQIRLHGEQFRAKAKFDKLFAEVHPRYMDHIKFMRMAFRDDPRKLYELDAASARDMTLTGWLTQSKTFYTNAINDEDSLTKMVGYGISKEELEAAEAKVAEVAAANQEHKIKKGAAQDAIDRRDKALDILDKFRSEFIGICRIALKDHPQLLEKLGIVVYTKGYVSARSQAAAEEKKKQEALKAREAPEAQEAHAAQEVQEEQEVQVNQETKKKHKSKK